MNRHLPDINIIACGALAKELLALKHLNQWQRMNISCLPAKYHNTPGLIPDAVEKKILQIKSTGSGKIFVAYGDCGTGGRLDEVLNLYGIERLPGAHCYQFFAGQEAFNELQEEEIGSFYLTDFIAQQFDSYVWKSLGIDKHPQLLEVYFSNYKRLVFLAQTENKALTELAKNCASRLNLKFKRIFTGYGDMNSTINHFRKNEISINNLLPSNAPIPTPVKNQTQLREYRKVIE